MMMDIYDMIGRDFVPSKREIMHFKRFLDKDQDGVVSERDLGLGVMEKVGNGRNMGGKSAGFRQMGGELKESKNSMNTNFTFK